MDHADDIAAIRAVIADIEAGFNEKDAERSVAHFTDDAAAVNVAGVLIAGREALLDAHRAGYARPLRDQYARYDLGEVTFLRPDVAIAHKRARAVSPDGDPIELDHTMIALYVFVRNRGRWQIAARQNTLARPAA
jgi:uncharacterized protein (TIGR02246 family)